MFQAYVSGLCFRLMFQAYVSGLGAAVCDAACFWTSGVSK